MLRQYNLLVRRKTLLVQQYLSGNHLLFSSSKSVWEEICKTNNQMRQRFSGVVDELIEKYSTLTIQQCTNIVKTQLELANAENANDPSGEISRIHAYAAQLVVNPKLAVRVVVARGPYAAKVIKSYRQHAPEVYLICAEWEKDALAVRLAGHEKVFYVNRL